MSNQKVKRTLTLLSLRIRSLVSLLLVTSLLGSCTIPVTCILYNNTDRSFTVTQFEKGETRKTFDFSPGTSLELQFWSTNDYQISFGGIFWSYEPPGPDPDFVELVGFGPFTKRIVNAQLESDGRIFLIPKGVEPPVQSMPEQPKGYPLIPQKSESN